MSVATFSCPCSAELIFKTNVFMYCLNSLLTFTCSSVPSFCRSVPVLLCARCPRTTLRSVRGHAVGAGCFCLIHCDYCQTMFRPPSAPGHLCSLQIASLFCSPAMRTAYLPRDVRIGVCYRCSSVGVAVGAASCLALICGVPEAFAAFG